MLTKHYYLTYSDYSQLKCTLVTEIKKNVWIILLFTIT